MAKVRAGDDVIIFVPVIKDATGERVPLTGATLFCDVELEDGSKVAAPTTTLNTSTGTGQAKFTAAQTILWPPNTDATYDARVRLASGQVATVMEGGFLIVAPITPQPA